MTGFVSKSLIAAAVLTAGLLASPIAASAGSYGSGYGSGYGHSYGDGYQVVSTKVCKWKKVRFYDEYYGVYRVKRVRVCHNAY